MDHATQGMRDFGSSRQDWYRTTAHIWVESLGAQGRDRTTDTAIFSRMLYQLSYLGTSSPWGLGSAGL